MTRERYNSTMISGLISVLLLFSCFFGGDDCFLYRRHPIGVRNAKVRAALKQLESQTDSATTWAQTEPQQVSHTVPHVLRRHVSKISGRPSIMLPIEFFDDEDDGEEIDELGRDNSEMESTDGISSGNGRFDNDELYDDEDNFRIIVDKYQALGNNGRLLLPSRVHTGETVSGTVLHVERQFALVEIGSKTPAYIPLSEASFSKHASMHELFEVGQFIADAQIIGTYEGKPVLSPRVGEVKTLWTEMLEDKEKGRIVNFTVGLMNRGGAVGTMSNGLPAFLPFSHGLRKLGPDSVGQTMMVKYNQLNETSKTITVSMRAAIMGVDQGLEVGQCYSATVTAVTDFGIFAEMECGATGLIHATQISSDETANSRGEWKQLFKTGDALKVALLAYNVTAARCMLSLSYLESTPGEVYKNITRVFENAEKTCLQNKETILAAADTLLERSGLQKMSYRAHTQDGGGGRGGGVGSSNSGGGAAYVTNTVPINFDKYPFYSVHSGTISGITSYGVFVTLDSDIEDSSPGPQGLVHVTQISQGKSRYFNLEILSQIFSPNEKVKVMILDSGGGGGAAAGKSSKSSNSGTNSTGVRTKLAFSFKYLEMQIGDILTPDRRALMFEQAEATAAAYAEKIYQERSGREIVAENTARPSPQDDINNTMGLTDGESHIGDKGHRKQEDTGISATIRRFQRRKNNANNNSTTTTTTTTSAASGDVHTAESSISEGKSASLVTESNNSSTVIVTPLKTSATKLKSRMTSAESEDEGEGRSKRESGYLHSTDALDSSTYDADAESSSLRDNEIPASSATVFDSRSTNMRNRKKMIQIPVAHQQQAVLLSAQQHPQSLSKAQVEEAVKREGHRALSPTTDPLMVGKIDSSSSLLTTPISPVDTCTVDEEDIKEEENESNLKKTNYSIEVEFKEDKFQTSPTVIAEQLHASTRWKKRIGRGEIQASASHEIDETFIPLTFTALTDEEPSIEDVAGTATAAAAATAVGLVDKSAHDDQVQESNEVCVRVDSPVIPVVALKRRGRPPRSSATSTTTTTTNNNNNNNDTVSETAIDKEIASAATVPVAAATEPGIAAAALKEKDGEENLINIEVPNSDMDVRRRRGRPRKVQP